MKLMRCPLNGLRGVEEFAYGGEWVEMPDPSVCDDAGWTDYVFLRANVRGRVAEWWCHLPSAYWFVAVRDTATGEVIETCPVEAWRERVAAPAGASGGAPA